MAASLKHQPLIVLYRGFPASSAYIWSPFVTKLEARLRFAGLKYRTDQGSFAKAPRGKIPYVEITYEGQQTPVGLGDSAMIARRLVGDGVCEDLNAGLSPAGRAQDACIRALLEDKLYFYQVRTPLLHPHLFSEADARRAARDGTTTTTQWSPTSCPPSPGPSAR